MSVRTSFWRTLCSVSNTSRPMTMFMARMMRTTMIRQARVDALVEWFFERFEDTAHRLPYESLAGNELSGISPL